MVNEVAAVLYDSGDEREGSDSITGDAVMRESEPSTALRRVPWADWHEWCSVRDLFCSGSAEDALEGVKRVRAWRVRGSVPVSVDATAQLAALLYAADPADEIVLDHAGLAIIRFVNGITETVQTGAYAISVSAAASKIGLPASLVEYRHAATHGRMPGALSTLRAACEAYAWLLQRYWEPQGAALDDVDGRLASMLDEYRSTMRAKDNDGAISVAHDIVNLLQHVTGGAAVPDLLVPALVRGGLLIPRTAKPRVFDEVPDALGRLWKPALEVFAGAWEYFPSAACVLMVQRIVELARSSVEHKELPLNDPKRFGAQSQYEQSLLAAWFSYFVREFGECLSRDSSSQLTMLDTVITVCHPPLSIWTERAAWSAIALTPPRTQQRLGQLKAILQSSGTSIGALVSGRVDLSATGAGGVSDLLSLEVIEKQTAMMTTKDAVQKAELDLEKWPLVHTTPRPIGLDENGELPTLDLPAGVELEVVDFVPSSDMPRAARTQLTSRDFASPVSHFESMEASSKRACLDDNEEEEEDNDEEDDEEDSDMDDDDDDENREKIEVGPVLEIPQHKKALNDALQTLIDAFSASQQQH